MEVHEGTCVWLHVLLVTRSWDIDGIFIFVFGQICCNMARIDG